MPFAQLLNENAESDTPFLQPWWYLGQSFGGEVVVAMIAVATALALAAAFLWLPARFAPALPVLVAAGFLATWLPLEAWPAGFPQQSVHFSRPVSRRARSWIDNAVGTNAKVGVLWSGGDVTRIWQNEFWNRSIRRVYGLAAPSSPAACPRPPSPPAARRAWSSTPRGGRSPTTTC